MASQANSVPPIKHRMHVLKIESTSRSFAQARNLAEVFDELSPAFDKAAHSALQKQLRAEKAELAKLPPSSSESCKHSGLRLRTRDVDPALFDDYMKGRNVVRIARLKTGPPTGDWVTIGVVATKASKAASNGKPYCIWKLSNLDGGEILLFLFGEAYEENWKEFTGIVVAILNPQLKEDKNQKNSNTPAYSVNRAGQLLKMGKSKDFGVCKALRVDGQPCGNIVNTSQCQYCNFHVGREMSKLNAKRPNLQNWGNGGPGSIKTVHQKKETVAAAKKAVITGSRNNMHIAPDGKRVSLKDQIKQHKQPEKRSESYAPPKKTLEEQLKDPAMKSMADRARLGK